jgi:Zn-dependent peptidase ImmA (M78 family)
MIPRKPHLIARRVGNTFREELQRTHSDLLAYPLQYRNLRIAVSEHFNMVIEELPNLRVESVRDFLARLQLQLPIEPCDNYLELAGFMYAYDDGAIIFIEQNDIEERKKFSLLHEVSHFLNEYFQIRLRTKNHGTLSLFVEKMANEDAIVVATRCTKNDIFTQIYGIVEKDFRDDNAISSIEHIKALRQKRQDQLKEKICDWFAAEVLMPIAMLEQLEKGWLQRGFSNLDMINEIRVSFEVSRIAAQVRAQELQLGVVPQQHLIE